MLMKSRLNLCMSLGLKSLFTLVVALAFTDEGERTPLDAGIHLSGQGKRLLALNLSILDSVELSGA